MGITGHVLVSTKPKPPLDIITGINGLYSKLGDREHKYSRISRTNQIQNAKKPYDLAYPHNAIPTYEGGVTNDHADEFL